MLVSWMSVYFFFLRNNHSICPTSRPLNARYRASRHFAEESREIDYRSRGRETSRDRSVDDTRRRNENEDAQREIDR